MRLFELRKTKEELAAIKAEKQRKEWEAYNSPEAKHDRAYEQLERIKEEGTTLRVLNNLQLFVPRANNQLHSKKSREKEIWNNKMKYAFDDEGNMIPHYKNWVDSALESKILKQNMLDEAAPILANGPVVPGHNKPGGAALWTSSATKTEDGSYVSDWSKMCSKGYRDWFNIKGYLYKIKPGTCLLEMNSDMDAKIIYTIFAELGRGNNALNDPENYKDHYFGEENIMRKDFPWQEIAKHFDGIHHGGWNREGFVRDYDVESIAWFKTDRLQLLGQCKVYDSYADSGHEDW